MKKIIARTLSEHEVRVLGCLMEKQITTPDYYPLTLKALTTACNQKSSRVPVMNLTEGQIGGVANDLRGLEFVSIRMEGRADRYEQHFSHRLGLSSTERSVLCALMLRGPLTLNEIRINTGRMVSFETNEALQKVLDPLLEGDTPLLIRVPRAAGRREDRFAHLLYGNSEIDLSEKEVSVSANNEKSDAERIDLLEKEVIHLKKMMQSLSEKTEKRDLQELS